MSLFWRLPLLRMRIFYHSWKYEVWETVFSLFLSNTIVHVSWDLWMTWMQFRSSVVCPLTILSVLLLLGNVVCFSCISLCFSLRMFFWLTFWWIIFRYPVLLDPTRRMDNFSNFYLFERSEVEMFHYTLVRRNIRSKLEVFFIYRHFKMLNVLQNVSNRANYVTDVERFLYEFERSIETFLFSCDSHEVCVCAGGLLSNRLFILTKTWDDSFAAWKRYEEKRCQMCMFFHLTIHILKVDNWFNIPDFRTGIGFCDFCSFQKPSLLRCGGCKRVYYCDKECQKMSWPSHKAQCKSTRKS